MSAIGFNTRVTMQSKYKTLMLFITEHTSIEPVSSIKFKLPLKNRQNKDLYDKW